MATSRKGEKHVSIPASDKKVLLDLFDSKVAPNRTIFIERLGKGDFDRQLGQAAARLKGVRYRAFSHWCQPATREKIERLAAAGPSQGKGKGGGAKRDKGGAHPELETKLLEHIRDSLDNLQICGLHDYPQKCGLHDNPQNP